ncbi:ATP-binding protein [Nocardioides sp.]|uniref:ATP-binding protein n=1 Tax=Nocardioides sp. TaxID=35761 RepID=UPI002EDA4D5F
MPSSAAEDGRAPGPALTLLAEVRWRGAPVTGERTHALLAALAATPGAGVGEGRLVEEIWGDEVPANPTKALQVVVSRARAATSADVVVRTPHGYRLGTDDTDVDRLRDGHRRAVLADQAGDWAVVVGECRPLQSIAIAETGDGVVGLLREEALGLRAASRTMLGRALSALGHHDEALPILERAAEDEPTILALLHSEAAVRGVPAALERYESVRTRLADELGVDPGPRLQALHAELLARDRPVREGLLYEASPLIGRDADAAALAETIRSSRVTSIVGAGGLGKTRLAHLMGRLAEQPVVHFVELAGVTSPEGVAVAVADVLAVRESVTDRLTGAAARRTDLLSRVVDQIGATPALLVLDNCEHLVDAVADLVSVLVARTPQLRVLTTSRAPLGIAAERVYQLPQLGIDDATELFVERASAARPGARLDAEEVRSLVARLDGLPLAVELAAAKVRVMSVAEIERRLDDRFTLLRGGSRDAPERHQTLLAVIDWSWNLLDESERTALRRLSVFRDGFSLDGADAVIEGDALGALTNLVEQSLITVLEGPEGLRYRLLETVREFGQLRLADAGDDIATDARLRAWGVAFGRRAAEELFGPRQVEVMGEIRVEEGNLVDILRRALVDRDAAAVLALTACLSSFWTVEGSHLKVVGFAADVEDVLADLDVDADVAPERLGELRGVLAGVIFNSMIFSDTLPMRALAQLERLGAGEGGSRVEAQVKVMLAARDGFAEADPSRLEELCSDPHPRVRQQALQWASQFYENLGDLREAHARALLARELVDESDGPWSRALVDGQLAGLTMQVGNLAEALVYAAEALPVMTALGASEDAAQLKAVLALAAMEDGRFDDAARVFDEIEREDSAAGVFGAAIILLCGRPELALALGRVEEGLDGYRHAVHTLAHRSVPGLDAFAGYEPWVLYPQAAALSAHVRHGRAADAVALRADLLAKLPHALDLSQTFMDYPVVGSAVFAVAEWEVATSTDARTVATAVRLLACADRFGYNRQLPSLSWSGGVALAEAALPGEVARVAAELEGRTGPDLREEVGALLAEVARSGP